MFAKISRVFLYASLFVPLLVLRSSFFPFIAGKAITFRVLVEIALLLFLCHVLVELGSGGQRSAKMLEYLKAKLKNPLIIAAAVFGFIYLIASFTGINTQNSLWSNFERGDGAFQLVHCIIFFALLVLLFPDRKSIRGLLLTNVGVSVITCLYALGQLIYNGDASAGFFLATSSRVSGTLGNPSYLAAYILINLAILTYFFIQKKDLWWRITFGAIALFETYILLNTGTRAAFLGLIIGIIVVCAINLFITKNQKLKIWLGVALAISLGLPVIFFATHDAPLWAHIPVINRLVSYESAVTDIQPRLWTWGTAISAIKDRPLLGYGAENFSYPFDTYYNPKHYGIESFFDRTHNIFLEYLVDGGVLLLLAWLAIFVFYYRRLLKQPKDFWWSIMFIVPIIYLCQGFFLFDTLPIYLILFLFLAFSLSEESAHALPSSEAGTKIGLPQALTMIVLTAAVGGSLYYTAYLPARKNYLLTRALVLQNTFTYQVENGAKTLSVTPAQVITAFEDTLDFKSPVGQEETVATFQKFVIYIIEVLSRNPNVTKDPQFVQQVRGLVGEADKRFDENKAIFPGIKEAYLNGSIDLRVGLAFNQADMVARGKKTFADALAIAPNRLELIRVLIETARIENDRKTFDAMIAKAKSLRPDIDWK